MTLTQFEWVLISVIGANLLCVIGYLAKRVLGDVKEELSLREKADVKLAKMLDRIADKLTEHEKWALEKCGTFVERDDMGKELGKMDMKLDAFHHRLDDIHNLLLGISSTYVTKDDCKRLHSIS